MHGEDDRLIGTVSYINIRGAKQGGITSGGQGGQEIALTPYPPQSNKQQYGAPGGGGGRWLVWWWRWWFCCFNQ